MCQEYNAVTCGMIPRACSEVLTAIHKRNLDSTLGVSYVEIYGDQVSDLLRLGIFTRCIFTRWMEVYGGMCM